MLPLLAIGSFLSSALKNWKLIVSGVVLLALAGYVGYLNYKVSKAQQQAQELSQRLFATEVDLNNAKASIQALDNGIKTYQKWVSMSLDSVRSAQRSIQSANQRLEVLISNVAAQAREAKKIEDAPTVPFFTGDNTSVFLGVDSRGAYHFKLLRGAN